MTEPSTIIYVTAESVPDAVHNAFEQSPHAVNWASGGTDGLKRLEQTTADCVVVEAAIVAPGVVQFVEFARASHTEIPIVVVDDADSSPFVIVEALMAGATEVVQNTDRLVEEVQRVITGTQIEAALEDFDKLGDTVRQIAYQVTSVTTRIEIERILYEQLIDTELYRSVWIGEYDFGEDELHVRIPVELDVLSDDIESLGLDAEDNCIRQAIDHRDVAVAEASESGSNIRKRWLATIPLVDSDIVRGVALVTAVRSGAFDGAERDLLSQLGEITGHAIGWIERSPDEFAETLIHELRNPLGVAKAQLDIGRDTNDDAAFAAVDSALEQLEHTIQNVSTLTRFDGVETTETRDLANAATAAWEELSPQTASAEFQILGTDQIDADEQLLKRLLSNLFRNALRHGGDDTTVKVGVVDGGFYVEDDGPGIPADEREAVFTRGYTTSDEGLGIGLNIVMAIAKAHGWSVLIKDGPSGGARIEVTDVGPTDSANR